jgi:hypothetical protein
MTVALGLSALGALGVRAWWARLPLTLGVRAARGSLWGVPVVRLRARLGRGRRVERVTVRAAWRSPDGVAVALEADDPAVVRVGAWTITLRDPQGLADAPGRLEVEVEAWDGQRAWSGSASFELEDRPWGAFVPLGELRRGSWRWSGDPWRLALELREPGPGAGGAS